MIFRNEIVSNILVVECTNPNELGEKIEETLEIHHAHMLDVQYSTHWDPICESAVYSALLLCQHRGLKCGA